VEADQRVNWPLWAFIVSGVTVLLAVPQDYAVEPGSIPYWATWLPALFSVFAAHKVVLFLCREGKLLAAFGAIAAGWLVLHGDIRGAMQVAVLVWVTAWIATPNGAIPIKWIASLVMILLAAAIAMTATGHNFWGVLPGQTWAQRWRVSLFPSIASTACFALIAVLILCKDADTARRYRWALGVSVYFMILSQSRSVVIAAGLFAATWFVCRRLPMPYGIKASLPIASVLAVVFGLSLVGPAVFVLQEYDVFSQMFLRGRSGLSLAEVNAQIYRPWLWQQHFTAFLSSPYLMGLGSRELLSGADITGFASTGSESYLTRLLASYGLPVFLFLGFLAQMYRRSVVRGDYWAYGVVAATLFMMFNYGSVFHASSPINALFLYAFFNGIRGFNGVVPAAPLRPSAENPDAMYFGILDAIAVVLENKFRIVGGTLLVGALTYLTLTMEPPRYVADAVVPLRSIDGILLRSPTVLLAVARQTDVMARNNGETDRALREMNENLSVELVGDAYRISVISDAPERSETILTELMAELRKSTRAEDFRLERLRSRIDQKRETIDVARRFIAEAQRENERDPISYASSFEAVAKMEALAAESEAALAQARSEIDPFHPQRFIQGVEVSEEPVAASRRLPTLYSMIIGGCVLTFMAFGREWWQRTAGERENLMTARRAKA
jgi:hypothetical protein